MAPWIDLPCATLSTEYSCLSLLPSCTLCEQRKEADSPLPSIWSQRSLCAEWAESSEAVTVFSVGAEEVFSASDMFACVCCVLGGVRLLIASCAGVRE